jgi:excinuclease UvrABC nuclease subunit
MEQCLGVCTGEISPTEYRKKVILPLVQLLRGGKKRLISTLKRRMTDASKSQEYEEAGRLRNQIASLERIHDIALLNKSFFDNNQLAISNKQARRIEGYDISNLGSTGKVGSMVVFNASGPVKSEYRKFKIKTVEGQSDVDCLEEVLTRRLRHSHTETITNTKNQKDVWHLPDVLMIDGGKPQVHRALAVVQRFGLDIPIVGIAKGPERKKNEFVFGSRERWFIGWVNENKDLLVQVRDEAHRFAISYQRKLRKLK